MSTTNPIINDAVEHLHVISESPDTRYAYRTEQKRIRDYLSDMDSSRREGEAEGRAKGEAEGRAKIKAEIAKNMKNKKIDYLIISECSGLSLEEIEAL